MPRITERDIEALRCIDRHLREHRYAITVRELGEAMGNTSTSTPHHRLARLKAMGYVDFLVDADRTIHVTDVGMMLLTSNGCSCSVSPLIQVCPRDGETSEGVDAPCTEATS